MGDPLDAVDWPLRTARLVVRRGRAGDAPATFAYRSLPEVSRWLTSHVTDPALWAERWRDMLPPSLVVEREGVVVGDLLLRVQDAWAQTEVLDRAVGTEAEIGWVLSPDHRGQGYAVEAVTAVLDLCFGPLGLRRVTAGCFTANEPSWRLMEKLGMRREAASVADGLHRELGWMDGYQYAVLADEWAARR